MKLKSLFKSPSAPKEPARPERGKDSTEKQVARVCCLYDPSVPCSGKGESACWSCVHNRSIF